MLLAVMTPENRDQTAKREILQSLKIGMEENCHCLPKLLFQDTWFLGFLSQGFSKRSIFPGIGNDDFEDSQTSSNSITVWAERLHLYHYLSYLYSRYESNYVSLDLISYISVWGGFLIYSWVFRTDYFIYQDPFERNKIKAVN